jgi:hypothetical protein
MNIEVKDPTTGVLMQLTAKPEHFNGMHGFRILHPNGSSFFIVNKAGAWRSADDHHIDSELLINIGLALEGYDLIDQVTNNQS